MRVAPQGFLTLLFCWAKGPNMIKWILERLVDYISTLYESGFQIQLTATRPKLRIDTLEVSVDYRTFLLSLDGTVPLPRELRREPK